MNELKSGNYWIKTKPWSSWEIARRNADGTWSTYNGCIPICPVVGDFIPQKKEDYELEERSVWLEMAEYALYVSILAFRQGVRQAHGGPRPCQHMQPGGISFAWSCWGQPRGQRWVPLRPAR